MFVAAEMHYSLRTGAAKHAGLLVAAVEESRQSVISGFSTRASFIIIQNSA